MISDEEIIERILEKFFTKITANPASWREITVPANQVWIVPTGKIYEVFAYILYTAFLFDLASRNVALNQCGYTCWFPCSVDGNGVFSFSNIDPISGDVTCDTSFFASFSRASEGWILSGDEGLWGDVEWVVRWRDVTDIRGKGY